MRILPRRNFARFILALYLLFCLIIRTAYQGKQFEFLQKEIRPANVRSIDEMIQKDFTFYIPDLSLAYNKHMEFLKR